MQESQRSDPRVTRTRKLIADAFVELTLQKDFKDITVKDITDKATINRATFYAHFADKYELMEDSISQSVSANMQEAFRPFQALETETFAEVFRILIEFQKEYERNLTAQCRRSSRAFAHVFEETIQGELEVLFQRLLHQENREEHADSIAIGAAILSSGVYRASLDWKKSGVALETYLRYALPYLSGRYSGILDASR